MVTVAVLAMVTVMGVSMHFIRHITRRGVSDLYKTRWSPPTVETIVAWTQAVLEGNQCHRCGGRSNDSDCFILTIATTLLHSVSPITKTKGFPCFDHILIVPPFAGFHAPVDPFHMRPVWEDGDGRGCDGDGHGDWKAKEAFERHVNQVHNTAAAVATRVHDHPQIQLNLEDRRSNITTASKVFTMLPPQIPA